LILAALVGVGALVWIGHAILTAGEESTDDAQVAADLVPVGTRVAGQVVRVLIQENAIVRQGQTIAELDDADYLARVKQAEAELSIAKAQALAADEQARVVEATSKGGLASAKAAVSGSSVGIATAEAQLSAARAGLLRAQTDLKKAEIDLARAKELRGANAIPQERLDNAQAAYDSAVAALEQAKANVAVAEESKRSAASRVEEAQGRLSQSSPIEAQIAAAQANASLADARVDSAAAALDLARNQLGYTKITAPRDGIASKLSVHAGQLVNVGQPVIELVPLETYVIANFKETQVGGMKPGQRAQITIDAYPGRKLEGRVESISGGTGAAFSLIPPDNATGNFVKVVQRVPVRIAWVNPPEDLGLRAGLSADVTVFSR
jgi:membrane fusion protein (multidrug efflux system)